MWFGFLLGPAGRFGLDSVCTGYGCCFVYNLFESFHLPLVSYAGVKPISSMMPVQCKNYQACKLSWP